MATSKFKYTYVANKPVFRRFVFLWEISPQLPLFLFVCFYVPMLPHFIVTAIFLFYTEIVVKIERRC
ncbi:predicted protein [Enterococcus casseliflavus EC10]|nr:predicted protein [Enterococcus casseliflavus EC10]